MGKISGTMALVHPDMPMLQVSHENIYTAINAMPRGELRKDVISWLRFGHAKRQTPNFVQFNKLSAAKLQGVVTRAEM